MSIQSVSQRDVQGLQQTTASDPQGTMGTLRFSAEQGGRARAGRPDVLSRIRSYFADLKFRLSGALKQVRSSRAELAEVREHRRLVGDLLSSLRVRASNAKAQSKVLQELEKLSKLSGGDPGNLKGWPHTLHAHVDAMKYPALIALRDGVVGHPKARNAVLDQISTDKSDPLRMQAAGLLGQVEAALNQRLAREAVQGPLRELKALLPESGAVDLLDHKKLSDVLMALHAGLATMDFIGAKDGLPVAHMLDVYFQSLPMDQAQALMYALRPDRLDAAMQAMSRMWGVQEELGRELPHEEAVLELGKVPFVMLNRLGASVGREIHARARPELRILEERLVDAVEAKNRLAASLVLDGLNTLVGESLNTHGCESLDSLSKGMAEDVRRLVKGSLDLFRDHPNNPSGSLNRASLDKLDDLTLGVLRKALTLHAFGLDLDRKAANAVSLQRVEELTRQVLWGMTDVLRMLSREEVDMSALVRQIRDMTGREQQRIRQLDDLGQFAADGLGTDDRTAMAQAMCKQAMEMLTPEEQLHIVHNAARHRVLLEEVENALGGSGSRLGSVYMRHDYKDYRESGLTIAEQLSTASHLLKGMAGELDVRMEGRPDIVQVESDLAQTSFYSVLQEQFGVAYDPIEVETTVLLKDSVRARLVPFLEIGLSSGTHATQQVTLLVDGTQKTFSVPEPYGNPAELGRVSLSIRGAGTDGQPVRYTWPDRASPASFFYRSMGKALDAMDQIAASTDVPLASLMNKEIGFALAEALRSMGMESPFRLEDGTVIQPSGAVDLELDVKQNEDGSFSGVTTVAFTKTSRFLGLKPDGKRVEVFMNPSTDSRAEVQFTVQVPVEGQPIKVIDLPQFRHHFDVLRLDERFLG